MSVYEARRLIDDKLPPAEGDRVTAILLASWVKACGFLMDMERLAGRTMSSKEMDAITTEAAAVGWLTGVGAASPSPR